MDEKDMQRAIETLETKAKEAMGETKKELLSEIDGLKSKLAEVETLKTKLGDATNELIEIKAELNAQKENVKNFDEKASPIEIQLKENRDALKAIARKKNSDEEIVIKATTNRGSILNNTTSLRLNDIGQLATRKVTLYDIFNKIPFGKGQHNGTVRYIDWDEATTVRAAAMIAEEGVFPESTAKWKEYVFAIGKVGDTIPVTEEFLEDETLFANELEMFLDTNVNLKIDEQLYSGNGTGANLKGIKTYVSEFTLPVTGDVQDPTIYDLLVKVSEAITFTGGSRFMPNMSLANIKTINRMKLAKDDFGNYIIPPFTSKDGRQVDTMYVFESNIVDDNSLIVGDSRYTRLYEMSGIVLSTGEIDAQFTSDMKTIKARKRLGLLIRNCDLGAFRKVSDVTAALTAITKP